MRENLFVATSGRKGAAASPGPRRRSAGPGGGSPRFPVAKPVLPLQHMFFVYIIFISLLKGSAHGSNTSQQEVSAYIE